MSPDFWQPGPSLTDRPWLSALVRDRLLRVEDRNFEAAWPRDGLAPVLSAEWFEAWAADQRDRAADAGAVAANLDLWRAGADVAITGQQPGFLGGPLYTLLKVATCIAVARRRTAAGRPTVPLFWCGGDDDDLAEALDVRLWDPRRRAFLLPTAPAAAQGRMIGTLPADLLGRAEAGWLAEQGPAGAALATRWRDAAAVGADWGRLHADVLAALFPGAGLLTVRGDDAALLAAAAPFTRRLAERAGELAGLARARGAELAARGYHAQIGERSLERPFHRAAGDRRLGLDDAAAAAVVPPAELRCGVLFRSPLQDWLFRPAAVIVGPGERAYLEQLRPVYAALDLPRSPLVPRAHATFGGEDEAPAADAADPATVAAVTAAAAAALAPALRDAGSADPAGEAAATAARWRGAVTRALRRAAAARETAAPAPWRRPGGRQERRLPSLWYAALDPQGVDALTDLAADHLRRWCDGDPREYRLRPPRALEESP